ncbi:hypothetical protein FANTH_14746 [Fusarium anthophilum]|uniref:Uncharacterized protein n=1 Tax=Fusarium anthophilum TaxID=48485 RepID=A0A8H5DL13_9HYPO|nr:hypothetical protein FANTH_14746 [Fusarium anthophilum]
MSEINPQISTAAVVAWRSRDTLKYLAEPDPKQNTLTFKTRVDKTSSLFEIWVPIYLKLTEKRTPKSSSLILSIPLSTIDTFSFEVLAPVPEPARNKLSSEVLSLNFKLNEKITILIPLDTKEQPAQGAQIARFSTEPEQVPRAQLEQLPAYDEVSSSSSNTAAQKRKRPRVEPHGQESEQTPSEAEALKLDKESQSRQRVEERVATLEKEKIRLEELLADLQQQGFVPGPRMATSEGQNPQTLKEIIESAQKEIAALQQRIKTAEEEIEALQKLTNEMDLEVCNAKLLEVQQEVNEMDEECSGIKENMVTRGNLEDFEDLLQTLSKRISGDDR